METTYNNTHGVTVIYMDKFTYTWTLINFRDAMKNLLQTEIQSPWFKLDNHENQLCMTLSTKADLQLSFCHKLANSSYMNYEASLIDKNGHEQFTQESTNHYYSSLTYPTFEKFVEKKLLDKNNDLLPNGNLTIRCTISYNQKNVNMEKPMEIFEEEKELVQQKESEYLEQLFESGKFSDVELVVEDKTFHLHKNILAMRSPFFAAMFEHEMKEQKENVVKITDDKYDVMKEVLRYIYTKKINDFSTLGKDIFIAADKYAIDGLKKFCEQKFINELSMEQIPQLLILIDNYEVNHLKEFVFEFLRVSASDITQELFEKSSISMNLVLEMIIAVSSKQ